MVYIGVDYFQVSKNKTERVLEVPMDTKTDFFGNSKNGGTKFEKVLLRVPILSVSWTVPKCLLHEKNPSGNLLSSKTPSQDLEDRYVLDGLRIVKIIYHTCTWTYEAKLDQKLDHFAKRVC